MPSFVDAHNIEDSNSGSVTPLKFVPSRNLRIRKFPVDSHLDEIILSTVAAKEKPSCSTAAREKLPEALLLERTFPKHCY